MGEVQDRLLKEIGTETERLVEAEKALGAIRERLHTLIRAAGSGALDKAEKSGPSTIARAMGHRYTREYIGTLLKSPIEDALAKAIAERATENPLVVLAPPGTGKAARAAQQVREMLGEPDPADS